MKFSLIIPIAIRAENTQRADMLVECLESIQAQNYQNYEIILKDAYLREPVTRHPQVQQCLRKMQNLVYICKPDKNCVDGQNQALQVATGDILHIVNGDDLMGADPYTLDYVNERFIPYGKMPDGGKEVPAWMYGSLGTVLEDGSEGHWAITPYATLEEMLIHNRCGCPAVYWNRAMFEKIGYFDYLYANDYDYWCRCYRICGPMYTERVLAVGRRWNQSLSHIHADIVEQEAAEISAKHTAGHARGEEPQYVPYE